MLYAGCSIAKIGGSNDFVATLSRGRFVDYKYGMHGLTTLYGMEYGILDIKHQLLEKKDRNFIR